MKRIILGLLSVCLVNFVSAQTIDIDDFTSKFQDGYYYTHSNEVVNGQIKVYCHAPFVKMPHNSVNFKGSDGKKVKLTTKEISSFVIGTDSFAIARNFTHGIAKIDEDFVHVDEVDASTGVTTVTHFTTVGSEGYTTGQTYYIKNGKVYDSFDAAKRGK